MVHDVWLTMFNPVLFFSTNFKIKGWGSKTKGWGSAMLPPFGGNTDFLLEAKYLRYLTLLSLHTVTVLSLTIAYCVSEVRCTSNVLHSITH